MGLLHIWIEQQKQTLIYLFNKNMVDIFKDKAEGWDTPEKIEKTKEFARQISNSIFLYKNDNLAEVGAGTGLVGLNLVDMVNKIYMIDTSSSMLNILEKKLDSKTKDKVEIIECEFENTELKNLDGVVCYMSLHHIEDTRKFIKEVKKKTKENGFLAIGDLVKEDGSFHTNKDVPHRGFDLEELTKTLEEEGFIILRKKIYDTKNKNEKLYPIFIIIAQR